LRRIVREEEKEEDTLSALSRVEHVSDFERHGSEATLVVSLELALIEDLNKDFGRVSDGAKGGNEGVVKERKVMRHATARMFRSSKGLRFS